MTPAQEILKLIETVDPTDSEKLDEIDARVGCYIDGDREYVGLYREDTESRQFVYRAKNGNEYVDPIWAYRFTRSRDALKAIRPEGWTTSVMSSGLAFIHAPTEYGNVDGNTSLFCSQNTKSEELAELHAIIQAIEFERVNGGLK